MDYDKAVANYIKLRDEIEEIERGTEEQVKKLKEKQAKLADWMQLQAEKDGLEKITTKEGTVFWTVVDSASVENRNAFFSFCESNKMWELMEVRAAKLAVREFLQTHNALPPGVNYSTRRNINVRRK